MWVCVCVRVQGFGGRKAHVCVCVRTCVNLRACVCMQVNGEDARVHLYLCACVCICVRVCIYLFVCACEAISGAGATSVCAWRLRVYV